MNFRTTAALLALSLAAFGCGARAIDLDAPDAASAPAIEASSEPGVLGSVHEVVEKLAVDNQRLYWGGFKLGASNEMFIQSCQKLDCAATLVSYDAQPSRYSSTFSVSGGQVYWWRGFTEELRTCPIAGCSGSPQRVVGDLSLGNVAFDDDRFYFSESNDGTSLYSIPLTQPGPRQLSASAPSGFHEVAVDDLYIYWLTSIDEHDSGLFRTRKDGTAGIETIANDVEYSPGGGFRIATDPTAIYWTNNVLTGSINRCPLTGCSGASEIVTGPLRAPQNLLIDGSELYYVYETQPYEYALATCSLPACAQPTQLFEKLVRPGALAMDDQYLYLATTELDFSAYLDDVAVSDDVDVVARIRRLLKPNRGVP